MYREGKLYHLWLDTLIMEIVTMTIYHNFSNKPSSSSLKCIQAYSNLVPGTLSRIDPKHDMDKFRYSSIYCHESLYIKVTILTNTIQHHKTIIII